MNALPLFFDEVCGPLFWPPYRRRVRRELADHTLSRAELLERSTGCPARAGHRTCHQRHGRAHPLALLLAAPVFRSAACF